MNKQKLYINDISNYKNKISAQDVNLFIRKYYEIICDFINFMYDKKETKDITNVEYTINRGISMIGHIFKFLTIYTKNIDLVAFHTKKAFLYYMEFMGQIGNDSNVFLKLTSKDAILFVYKKTIFDIVNNYKNKENDTPEQVALLKKISNQIDLINNMYNYIFVSRYDEINDVELNIKENEKENEEYYSNKNTNIQKLDDSSSHTEKMMSYSSENIKIKNMDVGVKINENKIVIAPTEKQNLNIKKKINIQLKRKFVSICNILNYYVDIENKDKKIIDIMNYFIDKLVRKNISAKTFLQMIYLFVKKYYKFLMYDTPDKKKILSNMLNTMKKRENIEDKYISMSSVKYINWLFTP